MLNFLIEIFSNFRYSGEFRDIGEQIDEVATFVWENVSNLCLIGLKNFSKNFQPEYVVN